MMRVKRTRRMEGAVLEDMRQSSPEPRMACRHARRLAYTEDGIHYSACRDCGKVEPDAEADDDDNSAPEPAAGQWRYEYGAIYSDKGRILLADRENINTLPVERDEILKQVVYEHETYHAQRQTIAALVEALRFYANPETYHAVSFLFDPPTGGFDADFDGGHDDYNRPMPGKRARAALAAAAKETR